MGIFSDFVKIELNIFVKMKYLEWQVETCWYRYKDLCNKDGQKEIE